jgi:hypothetical protein
MGSLFSGDLKVSTAGVDEDSAAASTCPSPGSLPWLPPPPLVPSPGHTPGRDVTNVPTGISTSPGPPIGTTADCQAAAIAEAAVEDAAVEAAQAAHAAKRDEKLRARTNLPTGIEPEEVDVVGLTWCRLTL